MLRRFLVARPIGLLVLLMLFAPLLPLTKAEKGIITFPQTPITEYPAELADFGYILDDRLRYYANIMTPPMHNESHQLCSFPNFSSAELDRASRLSIPVALLVNTEGCEVGQKVETALKIHKKVTNFLRFIVFSDNNVGEIFEMYPLPNTTLVNDDLEEMSFSAVSTNTRSAILTRMQELSTLRNTSSDFLGPKSDRWMLEMIVETEANPYVANNSGTEANPYVAKNSGGARIFNHNSCWFWIGFFALKVLQCCL